MKIKKCSTDTVDADTDRPMLVCCSHSLPYYPHLSSFSVLCLYIGINPAQQQRHFVTGSRTQKVLVSGCSHWIFHCILTAYNYANYTANKTMCAFRPHLRVAAPVVDGR